METVLTKKLRYTFELVKFSHTVFALPFALASFLVASRSEFSWRTAAWVILAVFCARTAAMAFNRLADAAIDAKNPRTKDRHLPAGLLSRAYVAGLVILSSAGFLFSAWHLNRLSFLLAPLCLAILFFYSFTKRWTHFTQFFLGLALGMAPVGAAIAATGHWNWNASVLGLSVLFWVAGFDLLYSLQDLNFDRAHGIFSLPVKIGLKNTFRLSTGLHLLFLLGLAAYGYLEGLRAVYWAGWFLCAGFLVWEHWILKEDLKKIQASFFTANGLLSLFFFACTAWDILSSR
jgi:4-hydroxybenzoate polyprenyltransferase